MHQTDHAALRRRQPVRQDLRDQGRVRHRRVRTAVRTTTRFLCRHLAEDLNQWMYLSRYDPLLGQGMNKSLSRIVYSGIVALAIFSPALPSLAQQQTPQTPALSQT